MTLRRGENQHLPFDSSGAAGRLEAKARVIQQAHSLIRNESRNAWPLLQFIISSSSPLGCTDLGREREGGLIITKQPTFKRCSTAQGKLPIAISGVGLCMVKVTLTRKPKPQQTHAGRAINQAEILLLMSAGPDALFFPITESHRPFRFSSRSILLPQGTG